MTEEAPPRELNGSPVVAGASEMLPYLLGVLPFGVAIGAVAASTPRVSTAAGWSTSWLLFSGTPQLLTLDLMGKGAAVVTVVLTVALVNLRLAVYSAALAPHWEQVRVGRRLLASYLLTDPVYVVAVRHLAGRPRRREMERHYFAAAGTLWVGWMAATSLGVLAGSGLTRVVPASMFYELVLVGMAASLARLGDTRAHLVVAALVALPAGVLPVGVGPAAAASVSVVCVELWSRSARRRQSCGGVR